MERVFYHGMGDRPDCFEVMIKIIESKGIKSLRMQESDYRGLYNGQDYISVCAWDEDVSHDIESLDSAFFGWVYGCAGFIISDDIEAIKCEYRKGRYDSDFDRISQYKDEWHVKDFIPISKVIGVFLPLSDEKYILENKDMVQKITDYASEFGWPIFDSDLNLCMNVNRNFKISISR